MKRVLYDKHVSSITVFRIYNNRESTRTKVKQETHVLLTLNLYLFEFDSYPWIVFVWNDDKIWYIEGPRLFFNLGPLVPNYKHFPAINFLFEKGKNETKINMFVFCVIWTSDGTTFWVTYKKDNRKNMLSIYIYEFTTPKGKRGDSTTHNAEKNHKFSFDTHVGHVICTTCVISRTPRKSMKCECTFRKRSESMAENNHLHQSGYE